MFKNIRNIENGFTLIELIIVVAIVLALSSIAIVKYGNITEKARSAEAYAVLADIAASEVSYSIEHNDAYTGTWSDLDRYNAAPASENFTFFLADAVSSGYVNAAHITGRGTVDYYMCIRGGERGTIVPTNCP
ncbi:MAG: prepilin-type N-terminal cleavage/methylation domain-containing protein [Candidatus Omnitrophota bacterium]|nr:prepilin-type N-terminal cleavage/methylation domain-containing protein [Candidatus Omnitrophota bacterium]